jgi:hypothetical protein
MEQTGCQQLFVLTSGLSLAHSHSRVSDWLHRRHWGSSFENVCVKSANPTERLYASKLPTLLQHAFLVAQAVVAQAVPPEVGLYKLHPV